jgi:P-type Ca2+ transporter type 2C
MSQPAESIVRRRGLHPDEAARRLAASGPNEITREEGTPAWRMLAAQFTSPLVVLLLAACIVSIALGEGVDAIAIATIVLLNGLIGFYQEYSAQNAVMALRAMTAPRARVVRDGRTQLIASAEVVVGDLLALEEGDVVAADARVVEAHVLSTNEASLTGESLPIEKSTDPTADDAPLGERFDRVFLGTAVTGGTGTAEVIATGMQTELGKIAHLLETAEEVQTPLQGQLARVGRTLLFLCLGIVGLVAALGIVQGQPWLDVFLLAVPLAVAAVPEGLPAVVTIALAVGVQRMASRNVLVRRLPAVETLGSATVICTDKTGTLTTGAMAVRELWGEDHDVILQAGASCSDAEIDTGDPTEVAIVRAAFERGILRETIEASNPRTEVHPFDAVRKRMSIRRADGRLYVKGAVDLLLPLCTAGTEGAHEANGELAARGLRVLAVATGDGAEEKDLLLRGLIGIADPPRSEAIEAIAKARRAGVTTVMITGDHPVTATAIAREMGLLLPHEDPAERVHARVTPEEKLRIVRSWKEKGAVVAMTGDGVNDAPALREAHIGIAMGKGGTEVTREAADMVLADDNFASIVAAIKEGRGIWDNIQKTVVYLLAGNLGELVIVLGATLLGFPSPLLPLHLLWVNLATDGLPALALVMDPASPDVLERPPRPPGQSMLGKGEWGSIVWTGLLQAGVVLGVFVWAMSDEGIDTARNLAFSTIVFVELFRAFGARHPDRTFWEVGALTNLRLLAVVAGSAFVQIGMHHVPVVQKLFHVTPLSMFDCVLTIGLGLMPVTILEVSKLVRRTWPSRRRAAPNAGAKGRTP